MAGGAIAAPTDGGIRAMLLQLGMNMWCDWFPEGVTPPWNKNRYRKPCLELAARDEVWRQVTDHMAARKLNMAVIDIGEAMVFPSHPELAIKGSWTPEKMRRELDRLRGLGLEPIPKLNFSSTHNGWLKHYRRIMSTPAYDKVCADVIRDTVEIFGKPRFFHIGYDEESAQHQVNEGHFHLVLARQGDLWKRDLLQIVGAVEKCGPRAWMWSDYGWDHADFYEWCPKSVVMSNWFYDEAHGGFELAENKTDDRKILQAYLDLDRHGFDQIPCGTNWCGWKRRELKCGGDDIMGSLVKVCRRDISAAHLKGFMIAPWKALDDDPKNLAVNLRNVDLLAEAL